MKKTYFTSIYCKKYLVLDDERLNKFVAEVEKCLTERETKLFYVYDNTSLISKILENLKLKYDFIIKSNNRTDRKYYIVDNNIEKFPELKTFINADYCRCHEWVVDNSDFIIFLTNSDFTLDGEMLHYAKKTGKNFVKL